MDTALPPNQHNPILTEALSNFDCGMVELPLRCLQRHPQLRPLDRSWINHLQKAWGAHLSSIPNRANPHTALSVIARPVFPGGPSWTREMTKHWEQYQTQYTFHLIAGGHRCAILENAISAHIMWSQNLSIPPSRDVILQHNLAVWTCIIFSHEFEYRSEHLALYMTGINTPMSQKPASLMECWSVLRRYCAVESRPEYRQYACEWLIKKLPVQFCNCLLIPELAQVLDEVAQAPAFVGMSDMRLFETVGRFADGMVWAAALKQMLVQSQIKPSKNPQATPPTWGDHTTALFRSYAQSKKELVHLLPQIESFFQSVPMRPDGFNSALDNEDSGSTTWLFHSRIIIPATFLSQNTWLYEQVTLISWYLSLWLLVADSGHSSHPAVNSNRPANTKLPGHRFMKNPHPMDSELPLIATRFNFKISERAHYVIAHQTSLQNAYEYLYKKPDLLKQIKIYSRINHDLHGYFSPLAKVPVETRPRWADYSLMSGPPPPRPLPLHSTKTSTPIQPTAALTPEPQQTHSQEQITPVPIIDSELSNPSSPPSQHTRTRTRPHPPRKNLPPPTRHSVTRTKPKPQHKDPPLRTKKSTRPPYTVPASAVMTTTLPSDPDLLFPSSSGVNLKAKTEILNTLEELSQKLCHLDLEKHQADAIVGLMAEPLLQEGDLLDKALSSPPYSHSPRQSKRRRVSDHDDIPGPSKPSHRRRPKR